MSALEGLGNESIIADTWTNTGYFYVRVSGKNGQSSLDAPFGLSVTTTANQCATTILPIGTAPTPAQLGLTTGGTSKTLVLWDSARTAGDTTMLAGKLAQLAGRPEVAGAIVDLASNTRIQQLNSQADASANIPCMYAKNLVAAGIKDIVTAYRAANPNLLYIVLVGGDRAIPFFRYADGSLFGEERDYATPDGAPVGSETASKASLASNYVLGQDAYGASTELSLRAGAFPVPDLAVGRLVETAEEASGMIDAYLATAAGVVATPTTSLVTGYDFLEDAANSVKRDLDLGIGTPGDSLISDSPVAPGKLCSTTVLLPDCSWDADALRAELLTTRHDLIYLAGHFSANNLLAADYVTTLNATELADAPSTLDLTNSIIFSAGCHSGYNVVDADATSATGALDWSQAVARRGATLIAGTGYQYGDTDFLEYSERIYAEFAHQLRVGSGPVSVGQAFLRAKQIYLASTPEIRGLHEKALLEATIFGLPMLSIDMPGAREPLPTTTSIVPASPGGFTTNPGQSLGLKAADVNLSLATTANTVELAKLDGASPPNVVGSVIATYYRGDDGVVTNPGEPALPLQSENVSVPGKVLRGVGFLGGTYTDATIVPLTGAAATEIRGIHNAFSSTVFYPMRPWTVNYYDALANGASGSTRLLVTPAQHKVSTVGDQTATVRRYSALGMRLFYSDFVGDAAQSAAPSITGVQASAAGSVVTVQARVTGNPAAGIQQVWVTHNGTPNTWRSVDLTQSPTDSTLWSGTLTLSSGMSSDDVRFMVQAVNGIGLVAMDDNLGGYHSLTRPTIEATIASGTLGSNGWYRSDVVIRFSCRTATGAVIVSGCPADETLSTEGDAISSTAVTVTDPSGITSRPANVITVKIDKTKPSVSLAGGPADGSSHYFGSVPPPPSCVGSDIPGSGLAGCAVSDFITTVGGPHTVTATARDQAGNESTASLTYTVLAWNLRGFYQPTDMPPIVNTVKGGSTVPLKFELFVGPTELTATSKVSSLLGQRKTSCDGAVTDDVELLASGSTMLRYDSTAGQFIFNWMTPKTPGTCYVVTVTAADGTWISAIFQLK